MKDAPNIGDWKIWPPYEVFYIESLLTLTGTATSYYEYLDKVITNQKLFDQNPYILIDIAENIINQAATISRYLWRTKEKPKVHRLRGEKLREKLLINKDNILKSRTIRNFIEHFDENLDEFLTKPIVGNFLPKSIVLDSNELDEVTFVFRAYIINEFTYKSLDREVCILPLIKEISRIHNLLVNFNANGGRLK
jgi:hypothetical protein